MREIPLTHGYVALVDDEDYERLVGLRWYISTRKNYAVYSSYASGKCKTIGMHRLIMSPPEGMDVDHRDGNGLNNQKANLRICTRSENLANKPLAKNNTSGFKGAYWDKRGKKWFSAISAFGRRIHLGYFDSAEAAHKAYAEAARKIYGEFARVA